jgi:hypothetical protein
MNILPLIFAFLIIFSCIAFTFLREVKSYHLAETTLESFNRTERVMNNKIVRRAYGKIKGEAIAKRERDVKVEKAKTYLSKRSFFPPLEDSKFNLVPLIKDPKEFKLHPLFEPLAELLRLLYGEKVFKRAPHPEKMEYRLLEAILTKARKNPELEDLTELFPNDPVLCSIYYTILKGTNQYNRSEGIPPLGDFVTLGEDTHAVFLSFASPVLLEALFNEEIASHVLQEEYKQWESSNKYHFFSKEDLESIVMKNPIQGSKFSSLGSYLDYSKQPKPKTEIGAVDPKTKLHVKKYIYTGAA